RVLDEVGASEVPLIEVYNKADLLGPDEQRRLRALNPEALLVSALTREGVDELVETLASRLALDVRRVTLTFDSASERDRGQIAQVYRHARVILHEVRDEHVSIV